MSQATHTQGELHTGGDGTIIYDREGWPVANATVYHARLEPKASQDNARRLVACWNACEGISTDDLLKTPDFKSRFIEKLSEGNESTFCVVTALVGADESVRLAKKQCDQLLAVLEKALRTSETEKHPFRAWHDEARGAIAAAKEGAK